jgi:hypothetical protein
MAFATLYRVRGWRDGGFREVQSGGRVLGAGDNASVIEASLGAA